MSMADAYTPTVCTGAVNGAIQNAHAGIRVPEEPQGRRSARLVYLTYPGDLGHVVAPVGECSGIASNRLLVRDRVRLAGGREPLRGRELSAPSDSRVATRWHRRA